MEVVNINTIVRGKTRNLRFRKGDVFAVPLGSGNGYGYCRYLDHLVTEFFDLQSQKLLPIEKVLAAKVLFIVWVSKSPFTSGAWPKIGHLETGATPAPIFYKRDPISKRLFLYQDGREKPATLAECQGLENAAIWSANHIEDRLRDHFAGRPNKWADSLKPKDFLQQT